mmetsp:Transcript_16227/g.38529  ORF Transcript_16227/g.38529 Transcript_16227/m.38529 type:complete len:346 (-) Transcript_16227:494-1531(-)
MHLGAVGSIQALAVETWQDPICQHPSKVQQTSQSASCQRITQGRHGLLLSSVTFLDAELHSRFLEPRPLGSNILSWLAVARQQAQSFGTFLDQELCCDHSQRTKAARQDWHLLRSAEQATRRADDDFSDVVGPLQELQCRDALLHAIKDVHVDGTQPSVVHTLQEPLQVRIVPPWLLFHHGIRSNLLIHDIRASLEHLLMGPDSTLADLEESATLTEQGQRSRNVVIVAETVEHDVDSIHSLLLEELLHVILELLAVSTAGDVFHTQPSQEFMFFVCSGSGIDLCTDEGSVLDGHQAHTPSCCVDEDSLAALQLGKVAQGLLYGDEDHRHTAGLLVSPGRGLWGE